MAIYKIMKIFHFWKVGTLWHGIQEEIMVQARWTTNNHTKALSSSKQSDAVNMMRLERGPLLSTTLQLDQLKSAIVTTMWN